MSARRLLLGIETSGPGGAEKMVLQLASALRERGAAPRIATMRRGWMTERAEETGIPVWVEPQRAGPDPLWVLRFARRLRRERIEIVHTHEYEMNAYGGFAATLARVPAVATLHGGLWGTRSPRHSLAYRILRRLGVRLVAVSRDLEEQVTPRLGLPPESLRVIHNGIPMLPGGRGDRRARRRAARAAIGIPGDGPLVLAVGNLYPVKDHASLLRAAAALPSVRVAIAGRGEEEGPLLRLAEELGIAERVHLLGLRDDVERLLAAADVFVQPSRDEGLPLAILEAMAAELPIVATDVGGIGEAILDGETGSLVPRGEPGALAAALGKVLESADRSAGFARAARERALSEFSIAGMVERYERLYGELLGSKA